MIDRAKKMHTARKLYSIIYMKIYVDGGKLNIVSKLSNGFKYKEKNVELTFRNIILYMFDIIKAFDYA